MRKKTTLVILAAGMGSRFGGLKQLQGLGPDGSTLLDYSLFDARRAGFTDVVFVIRRELEADFDRAVTSRFRGQIAYRYAYQDASDLPVNLPNRPERQKPWGTGHAVWAARNVVDAPFGLINADDFYGRAAYEALHAGLQTLQPNEGVLVAYPLQRTLSPHGPVSRGVCVVEGGELRRITEHTKIAAAPDGRILGQLGDESHELQASTPVSLNCFGFTPAFFGLLEREMSEFLQAPGRDLSKDEFYLPSAVMAGMTKGTLRVPVAMTDAPWFGMTYRDDLPQVQAQLNALIAEGVYPTELWQ